MNMSKQILEALTRIDDRTIESLVKIGSIEQHLKALNGRTKKNERDIECVEKSMGKLYAKVAGIAAGLSILVGSGLHFLG